MQVRNKALAGIAVIVALAGCASQEKKQTTTTAQNDQLSQQKALLAYEQQMAYRNNMAGTQGGSCKAGQAAGQAAPETVAPPSCNCSCSPEGSKSSVISGKSKATSVSKKSQAAEALTE